MVALVLVFKGTSILFSIVPLPIYIHMCIYCIYVCVYRYMYIYTLSSTACLYILEIKVLLVTSFASIFSHSLGCHVVLFMVSFAVQNLVSLSPIYLVLILLPLPQKSDLRKHWYHLCQRTFSLCSALVLSVPSHFDSQGLLAD